MQPDIGTGMGKKKLSFKHSKTNWGKRFSLKRNVTQRSQQYKNTIDDKLIKKWQRENVKFSPVIKNNSIGKKQYIIQALFFLG
jgi:hypothetical protein